MSSYGMMDSDEERDERQLNQEEEGQEFEEEYEVDEAEEGDEYEAEEEVEVDEENASDSADRQEPDPKKKAKTQAKKLYTPSEIKEILRRGDFSTLDTSRLSEEGQAVMRAMQAGLTPKLQETSELRKELAEIKEALKSSQPKPPPKDIYEAFDQDPDTVMGFVNQKISSLIDEKAPVHEIERVREIREALKERKHQTELHAAKAQSGLSEVQAALVQAVPDIQQKGEALSKFAVDVLGYSLEELQASTHLASRGIEAVREIARINTAYEKFNAGNRAKMKQKIRTKTKTEKPGDGFQKSNDKNDRAERIRIATETGDWHKFFLEQEMNNARN